MSYQNVKPEGSPPCWGWAGKYQDGDLECMQCPYRESCRPVALAYLTQSQQAPTYRLPVAPPPPQPTVPLPPKPFVPFYPQPAQQTMSQPPQQSQVPVLYRSPTPAPTIAPTFPQVTQPFQANYPYPVPSQILDVSNPNPMAAMYRHGAPGPAYYFTMHPGETVKQRLGKNILLRLFEATLMELAMFARHWTWPPRS